MLKNTLPQPFREAFEKCDTIEYIAINGALSERNFLEGIGEKLIYGKNGDCYVENADGLICSTHDRSNVARGYLDNNADERARELFMKMVNEHIIAPYKIINYDGVGFQYTREEGWQKHDREWGWIFIHQSI